jgi:hypothetical protein
LQTASGKMIFGKMENGVQEAAIANGHTPVMQP